MASRSSQPAAPCPEFPGRVSHTPHRNARPLPRGVLARMRCQRQLPPGRRLPAALRRLLYRRRVSSSARSSSLQNLCRTPASCLRTNRWCREWQSSGTAISSRPAGLCRCRSRRRAAPPRLYWSHLNTAAAPVHWREPLCIRSIVLSEPTASRTPSHRGSARTLIHALE
jgi:hypothetical protein